jgi:hypothetical protein
MMTFNMMHRENAQGGVNVEKGKSPRFYTMKDRSKF